MKKTVDIKYRNGEQLFLFAIQNFHMKKKNKKQMNKEHIHLIFYFILGPYNIWHIKNDLSLLAVDMLAKIRYSATQTTL